MNPKDSLPAMTIMILDNALATLARAAEAKSLEDTREQILVAQEEVLSVLKLAKEVVAAEIK